MKDKTHLENSKKKQQGTNIWGSNGRVTGLTDRGKA